MIGRTIVRAVVRLRVESGRSVRLGAISLATGLSVQLIGVATGTIAARVLGPEERGQFALVLLLPIILAYVGDLGVDRAALYLSSKHPDRRATLSGSLLGLLIPQTILAIGIGAVLLRVLLADQPDKVQLLGRVALINIPLSMASRYGQAQLQGMLRMKMLAVARLAEPVLYLGSLIVLAATGHLTITTATVAKLVAQAGVIGFSWGPVIKSWGFSAPQAAMMRDLTSYGLRSYVSKLSPTDTLQLDQWIVGLTLGTKELAYYVVALAVLGPARVVPTALGAVIVPLLASGDEAGEKEARFVRLGGIALGVAASLLLVVFLDEGIVLLFGDEFSPAIVPARIIAAGAAALTARELMVATLYGRGAPGGASVVELVSIGILLVGLVALPRWFGLNGVATSLSLSYAAGAVAATVAAARWEPPRALRGRALRSAGG